MLTLEEKKKILSKDALKEIRDRTKDKPGEFIFPRVELGKSREDVLRLLDYIDYLERENARLRRSII